MGIKQIKPTNPASRQQTRSDFAELTAERPFKPLTEGKPSTASRNNRGHITVRFRGGGHKRRYRAIDFRRDKHGIPGTVETIEYDPNRSARIALIKYADGERRYILWPVGLEVGSQVTAGEDAPVNVGNALPLRKMPLGTQLHNIELKPGKGGQMVRSAGAGAQLMAREGSYAQVRLPSGEVRRVHVDCYATVGQVGNCLPLSKIPTGMTIHNLEMQPGGGAKLCRSAGVSATLTAREGSWAQITLPSGEVRRIPAACRATIGAVGNADHMNIRLGKAGRTRWLGRRPHTRGVAMNPVDHPMGGGEGRTSGGRHPCSPTGKLAKGGKTRRRRKPSNSAIIRRRRSVRYGQLKI